MRQVDAHRRATWRQRQGAGEQGLWQLQGLDQRAQRGCRTRASKSKANVCIAANGRRK